MTPLERVAHDIICIVKYNSTGGSVSTAELKRVTDYLGRIGQLPLPTPHVALPQLPRPVAVPTLPRVTIAPQLPRVIIPK